MPSAKVTPTGMSLGSEGFSEGVQNPDDEASVEQQRDLCGMLCEELCEFQLSSLIG
jgi:hypothetical protein